MRTINEHLVNVFEDGELTRAATIRKFGIVRFEGQREVARESEHYGLPTILAVGYRVRSSRGTQFRQSATARLTEYLVKGFTIDDKRLENPPGKGHTDYVDELRERIRDIRASERRGYLRVREILALAADYKPTEPDTQLFFQLVQNQLHFAAIGKTAPDEKCPESSLREYGSTEPGVRSQGQPRRFTSTVPGTTTTVHWSAVDLTREPSWLSLAPYPKQSPVDWRAV